MNMLSDRIHTIVPAVSVWKASATDKERVTLHFRLVGGYLLLIAYGALFTGGQFYVSVHFDPPWRNVLLIASVVLEYWGLARLLAWMYRHVDIPMMVEERAQRRPPVVLASSGAPDEKDVEEAMRAARTLGRPVLLVNLATPMGNEDWSWIEGVWIRLAEQGIQVSAQSILAQRPQDILGRILAATRPPYIIAGRLERPDLEDQAVSRQDADN